MCCITNILRIILSISIITKSYFAFKLVQHVFEPRIAYIYGLNKLENLNKLLVNDFRFLFQRHPMLIFKNMENIKYEELCYFMKIFDDYHDTDIIDNLEQYKYKITKNIDISNSKYLWEVDMLGHKYSHPNIVNGIYYYDEPLIGESTNFISGETVYINLNENEKNKFQKMNIEINRYKYITNKTQTDYYGIERKEEFKPIYTGTRQIPLVYSPENYLAHPSVLFTPSYFEKVSGWSVENSRKWAKYFMTKKMLPYHISIQWQKGDLAIFNNRRFIYSQTPLLFFKKNYIQLMLPTKNKIRGYNERNINNFNNINVYEEP